jgi:hypothetical protein
MFRSFVGKFCLVVSSLFVSAAALSAACVTGAANPGCVQFEWKTSGNTDRFTNSPTLAQQQWMQTHMFRIMGYVGYWEQRLNWFPNSWFYRDSSSLYTGDVVAGQHPEWILHDQYGTPLYINWGCWNGWCPQYAPDFTNQEFRKWWINEARQALSSGYKGIFIDDVNLVMNLTDGWNQLTPVDNNTGLPMTQQAWEKYFADFLTEVRQAFPSVEICHNAIWFAGNADPSRDPYLAQQIRAADYINFERGFADPGLTGDNGFWSIQNQFRLIDAIHNMGRKIVAEQYDFDGQFSLAAYFLSNNGNDLFANNSITPNNWPAIYDVNLGQPAGPRYNWSGLIRRDFANGIVLMNPPGQRTVTATLPAQYVDQGGTVLSSITLDGREGAILTGYVPVGGPLPDGSYNLINQTSGLALDDPASSSARGTQMVQWSLHGGPNQLWHLVSKGGGYYTIQNGASHLFLTAGGTNGAALVQQNSSNSDAQLWSLKAAESGWFIINKASGLAMDDPNLSTAEGTGMIVWAPNGGKNQTWSIQ